MYFHNISYGENLLTFSFGGIQQLKAVYYTVEVHNFDLQEKNYFNFEVTTNFVWKFKADFKKKLLYYARIKVHILTVCTVVKS